MKNNIFVLSRFNFKNRLKEFEVEDFKHIAFISIHEPIKGRHEMFGGSNEAILGSAENVLNLWFDDAEAEVPLDHQLWKKFGVDNSESDEIVLFNEEMANSILRFVQRNQNAKRWILHCTAGISRSGAVGDVLSEYFGINYFDFKRCNPQIQPNALVKNILRKTLGLSI